MPTDLERRRRFDFAWPFPAAQTFVGACWAAYLWSLWVGHGVQSGGLTFLAPNNLGFYASGTLSTQAVLLDGEWDRLCTPVLLHAGLLHIVLNSSAILSLGGTLEAFTTRGRAFLVMFASGLSGSLATVAWAAVTGEPSFCVGASGAGCGIGAALVAINWHEKTGPLAEYRKQIMTWLVVWLLMGLAVPVISGSAHLGGAIGGAIAGWLISKRGSVIILGRDKLDLGLRIATAVLALIFVTGVATSVVKSRGRAEAYFSYHYIDRTADTVRNWLANGLPPTEDVVAWVAAVRETPLNTEADRERNVLLSRVESMGWTTGKSPPPGAREALLEELDRISPR